MLPSCTPNKSTTHLPAVLSPQALHLVACKVGPLLPATSKGSMDCKSNLRHCCSPEAREVANHECWLADEAQAAAIPLRQQSQ